MAQIKKNTDYFSAYQSASLSALSQITTLLFDHNITRPLCMNEQDVYIHYHTESQGNIELKVDTIYLHNDTKVIVSGHHIFNYIEFEGIDLKRDCLMVDYIFVYEALVDALNELNEQK